MRFEPENISKNFKRNQKIRLVSIIILYILLIPILVFSLILIIADVNGKNDSLYNLYLYTVVSNSMEPKMHVGDMVLVKSGYNSNQYKEGNIITFKNYNGEIITHRIEKKISDIEYITKGDNNKNVDASAANFDDIIGKVVYIIPNTNIFFRLLKNKGFFVICILVLIFITIYDVRIRKRQNARKIEREKYEKKSNFYF